MRDIFTSLFGRFFTNNYGEQEGYDRLKKEIELLGDSCGLEIDYNRDLIREKERDYRRLAENVKICRKKAEQFRLDAQSAEELASECEKLQNELQKEKEHQEVLKQPAAKAEGEKIPDLSASEEETSESMMKGLIRYRDSLDIFRDNALEDGEKQIARIMENMKKETKRILEESGVQVLDATGIPFSEEIHYIENTIKTEDVSLDEIVAETYRDGYRKDGMLLRPQKVVIYKYRQSQ